MVSGTTNPIIRAAQLATPLVLIASMVSPAIDFVIKKKASQGICLNRKLALPKIDAHEMQTGAATKLLQDAAGGGTPVLIDYSKNSTGSFCSAPVFNDSLIAEVHLPDHEVTGFTPLQPIFGDLLVTMHFSGKYDNSLGKAHPSPLHFDKDPLLPGSVSFGLGIYGPVGPTVLCECGSQRDVVVLTRSCSLDLFLKDDVHEDYSKGIHGIAPDRAEEMIANADHYKVRLQPGQCLVFQPMLNFHQVSGYDKNSDGQSHRLMDRPVSDNSLVTPAVRQSLIWHASKMLLDFDDMQLPDGRQVLRKSR